MDRLRVQEAAWRQG